MLYELRTGTFSSLIDYPPCSECRGESCDIPHCLTGNGQLMAREEHPNGVVFWPACPRRYEVERTFGQGEAALSDVCSWALRRGDHRDSLITAGDAMVLREYTRLEPFVKILHRNKALEERKARAPR